MRKCKSRKIYRIFQVISGLQYAQGLDLFTENTGKKRYTYTKAKKRERYAEKKKKGRDKKKDPEKKKVCET